MCQELHHLVIRRVNRKHIRIVLADDIQISKNALVEEPVNFALFVDAGEGRILHQRLVQQHKGVLADGVVVRNGKGPVYERTARNTLDLRRAQQRLRDILLDFLGGSAQFLIQPCKPSVCGIFTEHILSVDVNKVDLIRIQIRILDGNASELIGFGLVYHRSAHARCSCLLFFDRSIRKEALGILFSADGFGDHGAVLLIRQEIKLHSGCEFGFRDVVDCLGDTACRVGIHFLFGHQPHRKRDRLFGRHLVDIRFHLFNRLARTAREDRCRKHHKAQGKTDQSVFHVFSSQKSDFSILGKIRLFYPVYSTTIPSESQVNFLCPFLFPPDSVRKRTTNRLWSSSYCII